MADFAPPESPKLISRKNLSGREKKWNFHTVLRQLEVHSTSYFCKSSIASCCTSSLWGFFRLLAGRDAKIGCSLLLEDLCFQNEMGASLARLLSKHELEVSASKSLPNKTIQRSNINWCYNRGMKYLEKLLQTITLFLEFA